MLSLDTESMAFVGAAVASLGFMVTPTVGDEVWMSLSGMDVAFEGRGTGV